MVSSSLSEEACIHEQATVGVTGVRCLSLWGVEVREATLPVADDKQRGDIVFEHSRDTVTQRARKTCQLPDGVSQGLVLSICQLRTCEEARRFPPGEVTIALVGATLDDSALKMQLLSRNSVSTKVAITNLARPSDALGSCRAAGLRFDSQRQLVDRATGPASSIP